MFGYDKLKLFSLWYSLATGFGIGTVSDFIPVGTLASLIAIPIWWVLMFFGGYQVYYVFLLIGLIIGVYCCNEVDKVAEIHDHKSIVWDEFIGMWFTLITVSTNNWLWITFAFILFRILDILKPWPISWCDRMIKGGLGIILDDLIAAGMVIGILQVLTKIFY